MRVLVSGFPPDLTPAVQGFAERWALALPSWCEVLTVAPSLSDTRNYATVSPRYQYRDVNIFLAPAWMAQDDDGRRDTVLHEMGHALMAPADAVVERIIKKLPKAVRKELADEYEREQEAVVSDFAHIVQRLRASNPKPREAYGD